jgi:alanyl-tRNA synthetase
MTSTEIRTSFLEFFREKQHTIVPSSSLMPDSPNLLFTNAGMNQFVPIFLGEIACPYSPGRAADTQKCIRAGGKHNDLDDVGLDTYHHTFFEMLGNWSFGDYFKREAISWAWELIIERWKFPVARLYATIYQPDEGDPAERDEEAWGYWAEKFRSVGLDPAVHIVNGNKKDNFWMMGDTGPCGPCSELHVDLTQNGDTKGALVNKGSSECIEIWNLVFIQFNANVDGTFSPLPAQHVDTGMGFERVTSILQCTKGFTDFGATISNYETDIFRPIFDEIEKLSGRSYGGTLPAAGSTGDTGQEKIDVAFRVIADHIRTLSFAIADGIQPGNTDRNYVLRRILRRAVRYGRTLGLNEPFFYKLAAVLAHTMGDVFPEIRARQKHVEETLKREEEAFNRTLDRGIELFHAETRKRGEISGDFAFQLYDTYGFPLDLTELMARESGLKVDGAGFETLMEEQRARARAAQKKQVIELSQIETKAATNFLGYDHAHTGADVLEVVALKDKTVVVLNNSVCYAEMGGQVGDTGELTGSGQLWRIANTQKSGSTWLHFLEGADAPAVGQHVTLQLDSARRAAIQRHHSVTHLLHWALHEVVSADATQKGSSVAPDKLTFDFNSAALTPVQVRDIERLVNERIVENAAVVWNEVPYADVKGRADIMQFFGDKYGDVVRVVDIGGYSKELCAGTHVRGTGEIGLFRIVSEAAIAAGVRRIEAVAGLESYAAAAADFARLVALAAKLNAPISELERKIDAALAQQKALEKQVEMLRKRQAAATAKDLLERVRSAGLKAPAIIENLGDVSGDELQVVADALRGQFDGVVVLGGATGGVVSLVATVAPAHVGAVQAGRIIQAIAPIVGGKGGGRPDGARGGGKDAAKLEEALREGEKILAA